MSNEKQSQKSEAKTEAKQPEMDSSALKAAVKEVAEQMLAPALAAVLSAQQPKPAAASRAPVNHEKCYECGQYRSACKGEHAEIVVYPLRYEETAEFFPGVYLNGVKYLSNDGGHKVVVPAEAAGGILQTVQHYEQAEHEARVGRVKNHHSGSIGPSGSRFNPASQAWR